MRIFSFLVMLGITVSAFAQKKPLDHTVYDGWQNIAERLISNDGKYIVFSVNPQEGDGDVWIKKQDGTTVAQIARGYNAAITDNSAFLVCRIRPFFKETREARIKKKRPDEMPKDSLAIVELSTGKITKIARIKSFKIPDEGTAYLAYLLEKALPEPPKPRVEPDSAMRIAMFTKMVDSLTRVTDSMKNVLVNVKTNGMAALQTNRRDTRPASPRPTEDPIEEGTDLVIRNLVTGETQTYKLVSEYFFNKKGTHVLYETTRKNGDASSKTAIVKVNVAAWKSQTLLTGFIDAKGYRMDEAGSQTAFVADKDSSIKALQKHFKLYYHKDGIDSANAIADKKTNGMPTGWGVSEFSAISFSKSGKRLFFGTAPIIAPKDTSLPDFDRVNVDVWNYKDDYLQPVQLRNVENELRRNHLARYDFDTKSIVQLGTPAYRNVMQTKDGDGDYFYAGSDEGKRIATQWQGFSFNDVYAINPINGTKKLIVGDFKGNMIPSTTGNYLLLYNDKTKSYSAYNAYTGKINALAKDVKVALYDEENDVPDDPNPYGIMGWMENDESVYVYDYYDIWKLDPNGVKASVNITNGFGRTNKLTFRNIILDREERSLKPNQQLLLSVFNNTDKGSGLKYYTLGSSFDIAANTKLTYPVRVANPVKAKDAATLSFSTETYQKSADIKVANSFDVNANSLFQPNAQQTNYNWGTAELFTWKAYTGKETEGILYKPEDFDPKKKYPMIVYFYERNNNTVHAYQAPSPTPSRLNISFFVSRGYIVFVPDIWYKTGYPGKGAYDYILSGTRAVVAKGFVDSTKIGLQGQSWGGYQIVYLITKTNLYAAAWAGAPVANMTSAYGGIRWGTGLNRQFQYEKTQSRIGATLWEKPNLYIENSALFSIPKIKTPLVVMANDADDAVPWYQGIEMFTAMRRLNKPVWMLNYNNEAHNLIERKNRKDIQIREQQFFDYLLKGDKPAKWIAEGVPAIMKGRDWGLGY